MSKRRAAFTVLTAILLIAAVALPARVAAPQAAKPIKIGLLYSLTGMYSAMGMDTHKGATTYLEWINKQGGIKGHPIEIVTSDDQSDPTKGALAAKKLIDVDRVHAIGGTNGTGVALAVGPVTEEKKVPFVTASGSEAFEQTLKPRWGFRVIDWTPVMVDWIFAVHKKLNPAMKSVGIVYTGAAYGKLLYDLAHGYYAPQHGLKVVAGLKYDPAATDFGALISTLMKANPDGVIMFLADNTGPLVIKQMREMGMNKVIVANGAVNMKSVRDVYKDIYSIPPYVYSVGMYADVWWLLPRTSSNYKLMAPIATLYEEKHRERYGAFQQIAVSGMWLIKDSLERALKDDPSFMDRDLATIRTGLRDRMETAKDINTGSAILTATPTNHNAFVRGSSEVTFHWEKGEIVYDERLSSVTLLPPPPEPK